MLIVDVIIKGIYQWKYQLHLSSATFEIERWSVSLVIKFREGTSGGHTDISRYFRVNFHKYLGIVGKCLR